MELKIIKTRNDCIAGFWGAVLFVVVLIAIGLVPQYYQYKNTITAKRIEIIAGQTNYVLVTNIGAFRKSHYVSEETYDTAHVRDVYREK